MLMIQLLTYISDKSDVVATSYFVVEETIQSYEMIALRDFWLAAAVATGYSSYSAKF